MKDKIGLSIIIVLMIFSLITLAIKNQEDKKQIKEHCKCSYKQQYHTNPTITNRKCELLDYKVVKVGNTIHLNIEWYTNDCKTVNESE